MDPEPDSSHEGICPQPPAQPCTPPPPREGPPSSLLRREGFASSWAKFLLQRGTGLEPPGAEPGLTAQGLRQGWGREPTLVFIGTLQHTVATARQVLAPLDLCYENRAVAWSTGVPRAGHRCVLRGAVWPVSRAWIALGAHPCPCRPLPCLLADWRGVLV